MQRETERRRYRRMPSIRNSTRLSWHAPSGKVASLARLVDVSEGGALLSAELVPPMGTHVSTRIEEPVRVESCLATVVRYGPGHRVALRFCQPPAYGFFLAATVGVDLLRSLIDTPPDERFTHADD
jgi:hypothetical protein